MGEDVGYRVIGLLFAACSGALLGFLAGFVLGTLR